MKAVVYQGPYQLAVEDVPQPRIEAPGDALVRITTTNICESDLHMYEGRTSVEKGKRADGYTKVPLHPAA